MQLKNCDWLLKYRTFYDHLSRHTSTVRRGAARLQSSIKKLKKKKKL